MSIDKDIKQRSFKSDHQRAIVNLIFTYNWTTEQLKQIFDKEDLTMQQFNILRILRGSEKPITTLQIRERMLDKMSDTSRIVDRLIIKGLAKKAVNNSGSLLLGNAELPATSNMYPVGASLTPKYCVKSKMDQHFPTTNVTEGM